MERLLLWLIGAGAAGALGWMIVRSIRRAAAAVDGGGCASCPFVEECRTAGPTGAEVNGDEDDEDGEASAGASRSR